MYKKLNTYLIGLCFIFSISCYSSPKITKNVKDIIITYIPNPELRKQKMKIILSEKSDINITIKIINDSKSVCRLIVPKMAITEGSYRIVVNYQNGQNDSFIVASNGYYYWENKDIYLYHKDILFDLRELLFIELINQGIKLDKKR